MQSYPKIIGPLNKIGRITEILYQVEKRSILHVKATKIKELMLEARQWATTLENERSDLEKQVLALRQELARLKGEPVPEDGDQYTPNFATAWGGFSGESERRLK